MPTSRTSPAQSSPLLAYLRPQQAEMMRMLRQLVELESPSSSKQAADACGRFLADELERRGAKLKHHVQREFGDHITAEFAGISREKPTLLLGHFDTVWDVGTLKTMPFRVEGNRAYGPGTFDMKAGLTIALFAIDAVRAIHGKLLSPVICHFVSDEEVGSESSRALTEAVAKRCERVYVLEPSTGERGACKTARKGVGAYTVKVHGISAHAGLDPTKGASAIHELARQIVEITKFTELDRGLTVNVGVIRGGTRNNVTAAEAECDVDVRIARMKDAAYIDRKFRKLKAADKRCKLEITGGINRPPMERTRQVAALYEQAREAAKSVGMDLDETEVGGGSDGNFTAGLGIATLDGLGGVGDGAHATHEHILIDELPRKAALIAELIGRQLCR